MILSVFDDSDGGDSLWFIGQVKCDPGRLPLAPLMVRLGIVDGTIVTSWMERQVYMMRLEHERRRLQVESQATKSAL